MNKKIVKDIWEESDHGVLSITWLQFIVSTEGGSVMQWLPLLEQNL